MAITLDQATKLITVDPETSVTIQQLINTIRDWEDELVNMDCSSVASASGKDDLGGGTLVGITLKLLNWKLKFADKGSATVCTISGGNLVAVDENNAAMNVIEPSTNVTVMVAQSSSAAMVQDADIDAIKAKTDLLPSDVAEESSVQDLRDKVGLPTSTLAGDINFIELKAEYIAGKTANLPEDPADQSLLEEKIAQIKVGGGAHFKG